MILFEDVTLPVVEELSVEHLLPSIRLRTLFLSHFEVLVEVVDYLLGVSGLESLVLGAHVRRGFRESLAVLGGCVLARGWLQG